MTKKKEERRDETKGKLRTISASIKLYFSGRANLEQKSAMSIGLFGILLECNQCAIL